MKVYYVYLLECCDGIYYVGLTNDLSQRIVEHQEGLDPKCFTYSRRPIQLKGYSTFEYINDAIYFEKKIKRWSRVKKEAFFKKDWKTIHEEAKCKNFSSHSNYIEENRSSGDET